jgi:hypothetical protein
MTTVSLLPPNPQTLHLSAGDVASTISYLAAISNTSENPVTFKLQIIGDPNVVFAGGASSVTWTVSNVTTVLTKQPDQKQTFHLAGTVSGTTPLALKLSATDGSGITTDSNTHIIYF